MNAGLSNLATLKKHLLAGTLEGNEQFDAAILAIGQGVAASFEKQCNRKFAYMASDEVYFGADHDSFIAPRYPLYSVDGVKRRAETAAAFEDVTGWLLNFDPSNGLMRFGGQLGTSLVLVKVIFTGGYWIETAEPDEDGYPTPVPAGVTLLPADLLLTWLMQCSVVWDAADVLGTGLVDKPGAQNALATVELIPAAKATLNNYRRMQLL